MEVKMSKYYQISEDQLQKLVDGPIKVALAENNVAYSIVEANNRNYIVAVHVSVYNNYVEYMKQHGYSCNDCDYWQVLHVVIPERDPTGVSETNDVKLLEEFSDNDISDDDN